MARHGYTLQKSRAKVEFDNLREAVEEFEKESVEHFKKILNSLRKQDSVHEDCAGEDDFLKNDLTKGESVVE